LNPAVVEAMAEIGLDLSGEAPKHLSLEMATPADVVVTMGCGDACPVFPGKRYVDWDRPGPCRTELGSGLSDPYQIDRLVSGLLGELTSRGVGRDQPLVTRHAGPGWS
jgi:protein-tyrosine-phosphatase